MPRRSMNRFDGGLAARTSSIRVESRATDVGVGVIGAGRWGANLVRVFSALDRSRVVAAHDVDPQRMATLPASVRREHSLDALLSLPSVDAVVIATPPRTHSAIAVEALEAGKHVFVEKPMATSLEDALAVRRAALVAQRRVMVGLVLHYHPAVQVLERLVEQGALGTVVGMRAERGGGRRPAAEHPAWWSLAPHDASLAQRLFGARPVSISATQSRAEVLAQVCFENGSRAFLSLDDCAATRRRRVFVVGSTAVAVFDDLEPLHKLRVHRCDAAAAAAESAAELERTLAGRSAELFTVPDEEPLRLEAEHFVDRLLDDEPFATGIDHAVDIVSLLAAGERSMQHGGASVRVAAWR